MTSRSFPKTASAAFSLDREGRLAEAGQLLASPCRRGARVRSILLKLCSETNLAEAGLARVKFGYPNLVPA